MRHNLFTMSKIRDQRIRDQGSEKTRSTAHIHGPKNNQTNKPKLYACPHFSDT